LRVFPCATKILDLAIATHFAHLHYPAKLLPSFLPPPASLAIFISQIAIRTNINRLQSQADMDAAATLLYSIWYRKP